MTNAPAWECQRSVDADVSVSFAWHYMTNVSNWSDPPAEFALGNDLVRCPSNQPTAPR